ncbi:hypothetical protein [Shewanella waksmanii]|uniref:hypothetical protein n=1 Tax=Shewanella waksmanii TaxID=213783 RepID=UPI0037350F01
MWLIEFFNGPLKGVVLPIEAGLILSGNEICLKSDNSLYLVELASNQSEWLFTIKNDQVVVAGFSQKKKEKCLKSGFIYESQGVSFFVYKQGEYKCLELTYFFYRFKFGIIVLLLINLVMLSVGAVSFVNYQERSVSNYIDKLSGGFIEDGRLKVYDAALLDELPSGWKSFVEVVDIGELLVLKNPLVEIVSDYSNNKLSADVVETNTYNILKVDTLERDNDIMAAFGKYGVIFERQGGKWLVDNKVKAEYALKESALSWAIPDVQAKGLATTYISKEQFKYSLFYSSEGVKYLYDRNRKYWVGSDVPGLGVIVSISKEKVIFDEGGRANIYIFDK